MITIKEHEPAKPGTESQVEASAAPGETMSDADLRKELMAKNFAPEQEPDTPKKSGGSDGSIKRAGRWARANALLLAIIAVQGYTLAEVQATKEYAGNASNYAAEASQYAYEADISASEANDMVDFWGTEINTRLIGIESGLRYEQYTVQCSKY